MIEFKTITKTYPDETALQAVDLRIESCELFVLVSPSGSGKTTLLKTVNCLVVPTSGQVYTLTQTPSLTMPAFLKRNYQPEACAKS